MKDSANIPISLPHERHILGSVSRLINLTLVGDSGECTVAETLMQAGLLLKTPSLACHLSPWLLDHTEYILCREKTATGVAAATDEGTNRSACNMTNEKEETRILASSALLIGSIPQ